MQNARPATRVAPRRPAASQGRSFVRSGPRSVPVATCPRPTFPERIIVSPTITFGSWLRTSRIRSEREHKKGIRTMRILLMLILVTGVIVTGLVAQTSAPAPDAAGQKPAFKSNVEETVMDVVVRDKKGRLVKDLKETDFTVTDAGQTRPIKSFRIVEGTEAISASGGRTQLDPLRQLRLITLVFQGGDQNAKKLARDAALELIKQELAQDVYVSVMAIDHRLQAIQPFTNDRQLL